MQSHCAALIINRWRDVAKSSKLESSKRLEVIYGILIHLYIIAYLCLISIRDLAPSGTKVNRLTRSQALRKKRRRRLYF